MSIRETIIRKIWGRRLYHPFLITDPNTATVFPTEDEFSLRVESKIEKNIKSIPMYDRNYKSLLKQPDNYIDLRVVTVLRTTKNRVFCHRGEIFCPVQPIEHTDVLNLFDTYMLGGKFFMEKMFKDTRITEAVRSTTPTFRGGMITLNRNGHKVAFLLNVIVMDDDVADKAYFEWLKPEYLNNKWEFKEIKDAYYLTKLQEAVRIQLPQIEERDDTDE